jgi:hypothetical protein
MTIHWAARIEVHQWNAPVNIKLKCQFARCVLPTPRKIKQYFSKYVKILYNHKNKKSVTFHDSFYLCNPLKNFWNIKLNFYIVQLLYLQ